MFSLREITKIHLCRAAFIALCLLPTAAIIAWSVAIHLPGYRAAHEAAIAAQLGLRARLGKVSHPTPGATLYEALELSDPESGQFLARLPFVEVRASATGLKVKLPFPAVLNGAQLTAAWRLTRHPLDTAGVARRVELEAENVTLQTDGREQTFTELRGLIERQDDLTRMTVRFRPARAGSRPAESVELSIQRHQDAAQVWGLVQLATGGTPLACSLAAPIWPEVVRLGPLCEFQGRVWAPYQNGRWQTQVVGRLSGIDLEAVISEQFMHKLSGSADAEIELSAGEDGRLETAAGKITAGPGYISRSLVKSAHENLRLAAPEELLADPLGLLDYQQLSVAFAMNAQGLSLRGTIPQAAGALLVDAQRRVLLVEPPLVAQSPLNLARALVPQTDVQLPATRETAGLVRLLPLPTVGPAPGNERAPRVSKMRIRPSAAPESRLK